MKDKLQRFWESDFFNKHQAFRYSLIMLMSLIIIGGCVIGYFIVLFFIGVQELFDRCKRYARIAFDDFRFIEKQYRPNKKP